MMSAAPIAPVSGPVSASVSGPVATLQLLSSSPHRLFRTVSGERVGLVRDRGMCIAATVRGQTWCWLRSKYLLLFLALHSVLKRVQVRNANLLQIGILV
jgi:hypothetical protein